MDIKKRRKSDFGTVRDFKLTPREYYNIVSHIMPNVIYNIIGISWNREIYDVLVLLLYRIFNINNVPTIYYSTRIKYISLVYSDKNNKYILFYGCIHYLMVWLEGSVRNSGRRFMVNKATCAADCNGCSSCIQCSNVVARVIMLIIIFYNLVQ